MSHILLIDGNSLLFRAYYATMRRPMTDSKNRPTNAVYAFANMVMSVLKSRPYDYIFVAFDTGKKTFRHKADADYKANRKPVDEDLVSQFPIAREWLDAYGIHRLEKEGYEADDLIGSLALKYGQNHHVDILSSDHDLLQLIDDQVHVLLTKKGVSNILEVSKENLADVEPVQFPKQIILYKSLIGDTADNIPGVKGIGPKTAVIFMQDYDNLYDVYANLDHHGSASQREKMIQDKQSAYDSFFLATIDTHVDLSDVDLPMGRLDQDPVRLNAFYRDYDMVSLLVEEEKKEDAIRSLEDFDPKKFQGRSLLYRQAPRFQKDPSPQGVYIISESSQSFVLDKDLKKLAGWLEGSSEKIAFDAKSLMHLLNEKIGIDCHFDHDLLIAGYLVDAGIQSDVDMVTRTLGPLDKNIPASDLAQFFLDQGLAYFDQLIHQLKEASMWKLYQEMDLPLVKILYKMEKVGLLVDQDQLDAFSKETKAQLDSLEEAIFQLAPHSFNINSPAQLATILFDDLGLPTIKKRSTAVEVLDQLEAYHPIISLVKNYRTKSKFYSNYAHGLKAYVAKDGRIHTTFSQTTAATGRLASSNPNLQNISVRSEETRQIRKAFLSDPGMCLLSVDYSQIELRVLAHMANEPSLIEAFMKGHDIHTETARALFNLDSHDQVTADMRRRAKTVNFGIIYGQSDFGLSQQLSIPVYEAKAFMDRYFEIYSGIKSFMDGLIHFCQDHGYVETIYGRRRYLPDIKAKNFRLKEMAKRAAMNAPIQGSAADIMKIAMVSIDQKLPGSGFKATPVLQIHDELLFLVDQNQVKDFEAWVIDQMIHCVSLRVPLDVSSSYGQNWFEV